MRLVFAIATLVALLGCTGQTKREKQRELLRPVDRQAELRKVLQAQQLYDPNGRLLASAEVVAGLRLPRGLEVRFKGTDRFIYQTEVPLEKLHWYLNSHLQIAQIRRVSGATTYLGAIPRDAQGEPGRLDVTVGPDYPNLKRNILKISQRPPVKYDGKPPMTRFLEQVQYEKRNAF
jgi:hypothetical protein